MARKKLSFLHDKGVFDRTITYSQVFRQAPTKIAEDLKANPEKPFYIVKNSNPELVVMAYDTFVNLCEMAIDNDSSPGEKIIRGAEQALAYARGDDSGIARETRIIFVPEGKRNGKRKK